MSSAVVPRRADGSADLEHAVIHARRRLVDVRKRRDDATASLGHLKSAVDMARAVEDSLFRQLVDCEQEIHNLFRELVDAPSSLSSLTGGDGGKNSPSRDGAAGGGMGTAIDDSALVQLISLRTREEENTLRRLQDDLEAAQREYDKVSKLSQVQRAEMLRLVKAVTKEYRVLETSAAKEDSELFRMRQETQDVIARTHANKVRIVKELFQM